jgi:hypothetical protein
LASSIATFRHGTIEKVMFVLLLELDLWLTWLAVSLGLTELNPLVRQLLGSPAELILLKAVVPVAIAWLIPGRLLLPAIALSALLACWNVKELLLFAFA